MPSRESFEKLTVWYERRIAPFAFLGGFIFDILTLTRVDAVRDHVFLIGHLVIAGCGIALVNATNAGYLRNRFSEAVTWLAPLMIQFSIGALFSGSVILYWRSGSIASSWPFLGSLAALLIGNEFLRERYHRFLLHISLYFVALTSYAVLALPLVAGRMGPDIFVLSSLLALSAIAVIVVLLHRMTAQTLKGHTRGLILTIGGIFAAFNIFYFLNIIPPIPLALKQLVIAHSVVHTGDVYRMEVEQARWQEFIPGFAHTYHWVKGTPIYAASAVFAPTALHEIIVHHWIFFSPTTRSWEESSRIPFSVSGGRDGGYRGYTLIYTMRPGKWRLDVKTERGQLLGRTTFNVEEVSQPPTFEIREL